MKPHFSAEVQAELEAARSELELARQELQIALADVTSGTRAEKTMISEVLQRAFEKVATAQSRLSRVLEPSG